MLYEVAPQPRRLHWVPPSEPFPQAFWRGKDCVEYDYGRIFRRINLSKNCIERSTMSKTIGMVIFLGVLALAAVGSVSAQQQVYKCQNATGTFEFSDTPCNGAKTSERIQARDNSLDFSSIRESQLRGENEQLREQLRDQQKGAISAGAAPQRTQPDLQAERVDTIACERAKRDYEVTANSNYNSSRIVEAKRSMMYGTCGMREPDSKTINV